MEVNGGGIFRVRNGRSAAFGAALRGIMRRRAVITGGAGFVGSHLVDGRNCLPEANFAGSGLRLVGFGW